MSMNGVGERRGPDQRVSLGKSFSGESLTHQSHKDACDINNIVSSFSRTGVLPGSTSPGVYADVSALNRPLTELAAESAANIATYNAYLAERAKAPPEEPPVPPSHPDDVT